MKIRTFTTLGVGAVLAYLLDPASGGQRRHQLASALGWSSPEPGHPLTIVTSVADRSTFEPSF